MTRTLTRHLTAPDEVAQIGARIHSLQKACACGKLTPRLIASIDDLSTVSKEVLIECASCFAPTKVRIEKPQ